MRPTSVDKRFLFIGYPSCGDLVLTSSCSWAAPSWIMPNIEEKRKLTQKNWKGERREGIYR